MAKKTFNTEPYFDDFDETKNFHQILFKPKVPIQTRELNQSQSIIANQIEKFGNHIFKHGSIVSDSTPKYNNDMRYVRLKDLDTNNNVVDTSLIIDKLVIGKTTAIQAKCILATDMDANDPATLFIRYDTSSEDGTERVFRDGEELIIYDDNNNPIYSVTVRCPNCPLSSEPTTELISPTGLCTVFNVTTGIYYIWGRFVYTPDQIIILSKYTVDPSVEVGFNIIQSIIDENDDLSLLDNALGYPNYTSPGADRYKIQLNLEKIPYGTATQDNWVMLARIQFGILEEIKDKAEYADLMDTLARRTYDESGSYTVTPFLVKFKNVLKSTIDSNDGVFYPDETTTPEQIEDYKNKFIAVLTAGKSYVKGYEVERLTETSVTLDRARDTGLNENTALRYNQGNYIYVALNPNSNTYPLYDTTENDYAIDYEEIYFYDDDGAWENGTPVNSTEIGTAKVKSQINTGKTIRDFDNLVDVPVFKLYLFDIQMKENKVFSETLTTYKPGINTFSAKVMTDNEYTEIDAGVDNGSGLLEPLIYDPSSNTMVTQLGESFTRAVNNVSLTTRKKFFGQTDSNGTFSFTVGANDILESYNSDKWVFSEQNTGGQFIYNEVESNRVTISGNSKSVDVINFGVNTIVCVILNVITSNAGYKIKTIKSASKTLKLTNANHEEPVSLEQIDVRKILSVTNTTDPDNNFDAIDEFQLISNVTDSSYEVDFIQRIAQNPPEYGDTLDATYDIVYEYFLHNSGTGGYFFSANSYQGMIDDPNQDFDYEDIPIYTNQRGDLIDLKSSLDFRVDADATDPNGGYVDTNFIPANDSNVIHDIIFYLPRIDKICINGKDNKIVVVKGKSDVSPVPPKTPDGYMDLYVINMNPYTFNVKSDVLSNYVNNRRFTMRDIGKIEKRVDSLEYYVTLTMLEKDAVNSSIKDASGLDRFKNGLITDNFSTFISGDTNSPEFKGAIDIEYAELRPQFNVRKVNLELDESKSSNYRIIGDTIIQPFSSVLYKEQRLSSKTTSVVPFLTFNWEGDVRLIPEYDSWRDNTTKADLVVNVGNGFQDGKLINPNNTLWGNWGPNQRSQVDVDTDVSSGGSSTISTRDPFVLGGAGTTIDQGIFGTRTFPNFRGSGRSTVPPTLDNNGNMIELGSTISETMTMNSTVTETTTTTRTRSSVGLGERVTDVNILPFIRSQDVQFVATGMRPNTIVYPFFDDINVSQYCRLLNSASGIPLKTDRNGQMVGVFRIPNNDVIRFHTGDRVFRIMDSENARDEGDDLTTEAFTKFWSGGLQTTTQDVTLNVFDVDRETNIDINFDLQQSTNILALPPSPPPPSDPLAQSFTVDEENGCFVTQVDLYFSSKSADKVVWLEVRNMDNGIPTGKPLKYGRVVKSPNSVNISDTGSAVTSFIFESPVFLEGSGIEYCFVVGSADYLYKIHVARLGEVALSGGMITSQPTLGSMFKSQNGTTWNAEQREDIKFRLHKAKFNRNETKLVFKDVGYDTDYLEFDPFETEINSDLMRVQHQNHGLNPGDKVKIGMFANTGFNVTIQSGDLVVGQTLTSATGECKVISIKWIQDIQGNGGLTYKRYEIHVDELQGYIGAGLGNIFTSDQFIEAVENPYVLEKLDINAELLIGNSENLTSCSGYFEDGVGASGNASGVINGIPISAITKPPQPHNIETVDTLDSYTIRISGHNATLTGVGGGSGVTAKGNIQMDVFSVIADIKRYDTMMNNSLQGITHGGVNSGFDNYQLSGNFNFDENENIYLSQPMKISSELNVASNPAPNFVDRSLNVEFRALTLTGNENLTPMFVLPSFSFQSVTNRIDWNDEEHMDVAPNVDRYVAETDKRLGMEKCKYVLKKVTLKNSATMLRIYTDIYRPNDSMVDIYYKILPAESSEGLEDQQWILAPYPDFVSPTVDDFRETEITMGDEDVGQTPLPEYKEFRIKIVLRTKNSANPPKVKNFRAIAVT